MYNLRSVKTPSRPSTPSHGRNPHHSPSTALSLCCGQHVNPSSLTNARILDNSKLACNGYRRSRWQCSAAHTSFRCRIARRERAQYHSASCWPDGPVRALAEMGAWLAVPQHVLGEGRLPSVASCLACKWAEPPTYLADARKLFH